MWGEGAETSPCFSNPRKAYGLFPSSDTTGVSCFLRRGSPMARSCLPSTNPQPLSNLSSVTTDDCFLFLPVNILKASAAPSPTPTI